jgi:ATPase family associated with various cellular activities (AAA)
MSATIVTQLAAWQTTVRGYVDGYRSWIGATLGCQAEEFVLLELDFPIIQVAARRLFPGVRLRSTESITIRELEKRVESIALPRESYPAFEIHLVGEPRGRLSRRSQVLEAKWQDGPAALWLRGFDTPVIAASIPILQAGKGIEETCDCVILKRTCAPQFLQLIGKILKRREASHVYVFGSGHQRIAQFSWDDLVLSEPVVNLIRRDFESFLARETWFRSRRLPFRRGYLFHGPPGNGKTSVIRAMLNSGKLDGHSVALFGDKTDDSYLERMFDLAARNAPSLIVLEDIDRAFSKLPSQSFRTKVSLPHLLNCLDGLGTREGVIVVATANDPSALDPAILRRPGRFDRVVAFPAPTSELRKRYLRRFMPHVTEEELQDSVHRSEGFSFAQMREVYILAGQRAYEKGEEISGLELKEAIDILGQGIAAAAKRESEVGFSAASVASPGPTFLNSVAQRGDR